MSFIDVYYPVITILRDEIGEQLTFLSINGMTYKYKWTNDLHL